MGDLDTPELLHTMAANAVAPLCCAAGCRSSRRGRRLRRRARRGGRRADSRRRRACRRRRSGRAEADAPPAADAAWGHIVNVSALEGKFAVGEKARATRTRT